MWTKTFESKIGLLLLLVALFFINYAETQLEEQLKVDAQYDRGYRIAQAFHGLEGNLELDAHERVPVWVIAGYSFSYFLLFPAMQLGMAVALWLRRSVAPFRLFTLAIVITYLLSLPFFLFFPVPERWAFPGANTILLSDVLSTKLIEVIRPISGLDNCFPSTHVSFTVIAVLLAYLFRFRLRHALLFLGLTVVASTLVLGIHWIPDMLMGTAVGALGVFAAVWAERQRSEGAVDLPALARPSRAAAVPEPAVSRLAVKGLAGRIRSRLARRAAEPVSQMHPDAVFVSYRRERGSRMARLIQSELRRRNFKSFLDVDDLGPRHFDENLMFEIERAAHFIVILTPGALDSCHNEDDWLRREIAYAISTNRNIVPLTTEDFVYPQREQLPEDIRDLLRFNSVHYSHEYFEATFDKLERFLRKGAKPGFGR